MASPTLLTTTVPVAVGQQTSVWGDVPTWVAAIGTAGTLIATVYLLYRREQERHKGQAVLVSAWMDESARADDEETWDLTYLARNHSEEPVYDVVLTADCGVRGTYVRWLGTMAPGELRRVKIKLSGTPRAQEYQPHLTFTDAAGHRWLRTSAGQLRKPTRSDERHLRESPGAYGSVDEHPTLRHDGPGYEFEGHKVKDRSEGAH